ncbi:hypothetical protein [Thalassorhabdomicrobium marinisediminis]|uniref:hypothetical protein n=1 Tax=Thalassorhabdomicrobium marinisediminis TaxID=2170577 RepID=UPI001304FA64|nr:hypothetical protein [Thalassorhabdomicrobium marinisediminis]
MREKTDNDRLTMLEDALLEYVGRYGLTPRARAAFELSTEKGTETVLTSAGQEKATQQT